MTVHPIGHFDIYQDPWMSKCTDEAVQWYRKHLG